MHRGGKTRLLHRVGDSGKRVAWSSSERKVGGSVEDYLDRCAALVRARRSRGLSKVLLEVRDERRQQFFQLFDTREKKDHFVASRIRWLEHQGERAALQESWRNEWHDIMY